MSDVKFIQEFEERDVEFTKVSTIFEEPMPIWPNQCEEDEPDPENKVSSIFPGWKKAAQNYGVQASIKELEEVKNSLKKLARGKGKICSDPVHEAARNGDVKLIEFIIKTSFDMNTKDSRYGWTALQVACTNGKTETVQLIIQNSKDFGIDLNAKDNRGNTAWHYACQYGRTEIAQLIIQYSKDFGIDLNAATAWLSACYEGHTETAELIIQNSKDFGIDLNAKDEDGSTALHWACWNGRTETVQMILKNWKEFGIDIKVQNNRGQTALDHVNHVGK